MKRVVCFGLAVVAAFVFAACSVSEESSSEASGLSSSTAESDSVYTDTPEDSSENTEPVETAAVIAYPELVDERLAASSVYQQALERPSVIAYQDEVVTDAQPVYDFIDKKNGDLYIYEFQSSPDYGEGCYFSHYFADETGTVKYSDGYAYNWDSITESGEMEAGSVFLNEYGYFCYGEDMGVQVVNDRVLYDDAEERQRLHSAYIRPIFYSGIASHGEWASPEEIGSWVFLFEDIYYYENNASPWEQFGSDWPIDDIVAVLSRYFDDITPEVVIKNARYNSGMDYDAQTNTIHYEGGRGGVPMPVRVTGYSQEGDVLRIEYEGYSFNTGVPMGEERILSVRLVEDGSFRYISNLPKNG